MNETPSSFDAFFQFLKEENGAYGWICPRCGRSNAPNLNTCPCSNYTEPTRIPWPPVQPISPQHPDRNIFWCQGGTGNMQNGHSATYNRC